VLIRREWYGEYFLLLKVKQTRSGPAPFARWWPRAVIGPAFWTTVLPRFRWILAVELDGLYVHTRFQDSTQMI